MSKIKTEEEILRSVCNYKHEDKMEMSDDITIEEALEAITEQRVLKDKEIEELKAILKIGNKHEAIRELKVKDKEQQDLIADCLQRNIDLKSHLTRAQDISFKVQEENNVLKREIEKIKGEKKKEYLRAQKLNTEVSTLTSRLAELEKGNEGIWNNACKTLLTDISKMFKNNSQADKESDKDVFQAISETIINFPIPSPLNTNE